MNERYSYFCMFWKLLAKFLETTYKILLKYLEGNMTYPGVHNYRSSPLAALVHMLVQ